jgi:cystathionine gamma-synthase
MPVDLLTSPRWKAEHLGLPMPDSLHAVSACLPLWEHNIRYEEGDPAVVSRLKAAYPRFCLHPLVRQLCQKVLGNDTTGLIFPSQRSATRARDYALYRGAREARLIPVEHYDATGVQVHPDDLSKVREYWQHVGEVISSRVAELILQDKPAAYTATPARDAVKHRLRELRKSESGDVLLFPCGMSAIAAVWRTIRQIDPTSPSVQFGFPYVDTLKIQQRFSPAQYQFFPIGDSSDLVQLEQVAARQKISAVFCEAPTNPLLSMPDLQQLRTLADRHGFLLVVDDTLAACINDDVLPFADAVVTSLTKYFSGYGDVLAGSVTLNPRSHYYSILRSGLAHDFEELLADADVEVLEQNSRDVVDRVQTINSSAKILAARLHSHPAVQSVFHPSLTSGAGPGGHGGLLSIVLRDAAHTTPDFFDNLEVCKGPNLGTHFTLCCPYTILAHYHELDFVETCGVSRWLLRISIGTEPVEELWQRFERALNCVSPISA